MSLAAIGYNTKVIDFVMVFPRHPPPHALVNQEWCGGRVCFEIEEYKVPEGL
jgi:hypothetical protein